MVTVLMAVYNAESFLREAIESILNQSFQDYEFVIVNDGSTDASAKIIASYRDTRIRCITNDRNIKLCRSLAKGVSLARGRFVARMDADDIAYPNRLERQVSAMLADPALNLLGTAVRWIDSAGTPIRRPSLVVDPVEIKWKMFFRNCFNHPTVMFRKSALQVAELNYGVIPFEVNQFITEPLDGIGDEDYLLFGLLTLAGKVGNLDETLLDYRLHGTSLTSIHAVEQSAQARRIGHALAQIYLKSSTDCSSPESRATSTSAGIDEQLTTSLLDKIAKKLKESYADTRDRQKIASLNFLYQAMLTCDSTPLWKRIIVGVRMVFGSLRVGRHDYIHVLGYVIGSQAIVTIKQKINSAYRR